MDTRSWRDAEREHTDAVVGRDTLAEMFEGAADRNAAQDAQLYKTGCYERTLPATETPGSESGRYRALTYAEMRESVRHLAAGFRELGVGSDDRVGIFANTRMEWAQTDFALLAAGGVVTTVYTESSPQQVGFLLGDPDAIGVVVENGDLLDRVLEVEDDLDLEFIVAMDEIYGHGDREDIYTLGEVARLGADAFEESAYRGWLGERDPGDLATLIYTSGTTGTPKGVKLTHWNLRSNVNQTRKRIGPRPDKPEDVPTLDSGTRTISFLPLAHVFERTAGHFLMFATGATVGYAESPDTIPEDINKIRPQTGTSVPRIYERIFGRMRDTAGETATKQRIFEWAVDVARAYARADPPGPLLRAKHRLADYLVYESVRSRLGGNVEFMVSGGGSLGTELAELFLGMGLPILEGYGLTETSPVVSVNPPEDVRPGTLGPPVVDVETRLDTELVTDEEFPDAEGEVGELQVKGPNVYPGYWELPEDTERVFTDDGWFRTGDIVEQTADGYLIYRDRMKQILVLDTGKNVAPGRIENEFATSERVEQIMAVGDGQKFVSALIAPNFERLERWAEREGIDLPDDRTRLCQDERVRQWIGEEVERVNENLEPVEQVKQFRLTPEEWTPDNELLTPSLKKKRRTILQRFNNQVEDIYEE
ncbi:AMP-dependent synthetase/ligase [Halapricum desulfuricans]|uniref:AMP-dependent synthetase/ligase n=1 Tax=Halapricum desulfuricans TaxID=2841257 RepID=UPI001E5E82DE|nr:long-chain fatty acid--CoA ligase [Halapricum desulfuricans]